MSTENRIVKCLTPIQKEKIMIDRHLGASTTFLSEKYNVSARTIGRVFTEMDALGEVIKVPVEEVSKTPSQQLGYEVGDQFEVNSEADDCFSIGSIVELIEDDNSTCPKFKLVSGSCECTNNESYEYLTSVTPYEAVEEVEEPTEEQRITCVDLGYKVGDLFVTGDKGDAFSEGSIIKLELDDGSICPYFLLVSGNCNFGSGAYKYLSNITPYVEEPTEETPQLRDFQVGDNVVVINDGKVHTTYDAMAVEMDLDSYTNGYGNEFNLEGLEGVVAALGTYGSGGKDLVGVTLDNGNQVIFGFDGLEKIVMKVEVEDDQWIADCSNFGADAPEEVEEAPQAPQDYYLCIPHHSITIVYEGETVTVDFTHPCFGDIVQAAQEGELEIAYDLADTKNAINKYMQGSVVIEGDTVFYKGEAVQSDLAGRIIHQMQMGEEGFKSLVAFMNKLEENPSFKTRMELFGFISHTDIEITEEGDLLCWKSIRSNYTDHHTGKIDNSVGANPKMERKDVNDNSSETCSDGLHCCAKGYFGSLFGGSSNVFVQVQVNPKDVVSIPVDYNNMKMRTCEYKVLKEVDYSELV